MLVKAEKCGKFWLWFGVESSHGDAGPRLDEEGKGREGMVNTSTKVESDLGWLVR